MKSFLLPVFVLLSSCKVNDSLGSLNDPSNPLVIGADLKAALEDDQQKPTGELSVDLKADVALLSACQNDSHCTVTGYTPKTCGGFLDYVVLSQSSNSESELVHVLPSADYSLTMQRILAYRARVNVETTGMISTCDYLEAPKGVCNVGTKKCEMRSRYEALSANQ